MFSTPYTQLLGIIAVLIALTLLVGCKAENNVPYKPPVYTVTCNFNNREVVYLAHNYNFYSHGLVTIYTATHKYELTQIPCVAREIK